MFLKNIKLINFRNYASIDVDFLNGVNLVCGNNAQGKTNIVEAIYMLALSSSFKTSRDAEIVKSGENEYYLQAEIESKEGTKKIKIKYNGIKKELYLNSEKVSSVSEFLGAFCVVLFTPDEMKIIKGSPENRREFIDTDISQLSKVYYDITLKYQKILFQRNKLLKTERDKNQILMQISAWDEQFSKIASKIIITRRKFLKKLVVYANEELKELSNGKETLEFEYLSVLGDDIESIRKNIKSELNNSLLKEMEVGYTMVGPHRDDVKFLVNGVDVRIFGSQGQQRSVLLAIKFAEMKVFEEEINEKPVLLLDDVFSELDSIRQGKLYEKIKDFQSIITGTKFKNKINCNYKKIIIKNSLIKQEKLVLVT
ncbi:MAG: DNA replication/repair protein RecF [Clostridia bacterium]